MPVGSSFRMEVVLGPRPRSLNWKNMWRVPSEAVQTACWPAGLFMMMTEKCSAVAGMSAGSGGTGEAEGGADCDQRAEANRQDRRMTERNCLCMHTLS